MDTDAFDLQEIKKWGSLFMFWHFYLVWRQQTRNLYIFLNRNSFLFLIEYYMKLKMSLCFSFNAFKLFIHCHFKGAADLAGSWIIKHDTFCLLIHRDTALVQFIHPWNVFSTEHCNKDLLDASPNEKISDMNIYYS